jgi:hypothetical protein
MQDNSSLGFYALEALRVRLTKVFPAQIRSCVEKLNDEQLWWRANEQSNSVGNLVLHVSGGVMHYLCHLVGGFDYARDREKEFATKSMAKEELLAVFDAMVENTEKTFAKLQVTSLMEPSSVPRFYSTIYEDIFGIAMHVAAHTGQIVYATKLLQEGSLSELWMVSHSEHGAWKVSTTS